jgi:predicted metalloendopeptidase
LNGPGAIPFRRATPAGLGLADRVEAVEIDLERLIRGWDQHIPKMLAVAIDQRAAKFDASELEARLHELQIKVAELEKKLVKSGQIETEYVLSNIQTASEPKRSAKSVGRRSKQI